MDFKWFYGTNEPAIEDAWKVRRDVFIQEQSVNEAEEIDGMDDQRHHVIGYLNHQAVATARVYFSSDTILKIQRVAVSKNFRGQHLGSQLLLEIEAWALKQGAEKLILSAQDPVVAFYESLGFSISNPQGYLDAGIPHHDMSKSLSNES